MLENKILEKVERSIESITPNVLDAVLNNVDKEMKDMTTTNMTTGTNTATTGTAKKRYIPFVGVAVCTALVIGVFAQGFIGKSVDEIYSTIGIDVNPSIELDLSKDEKVVDVDALNEDGEKVLEGMELEGLEADVAVNAVLGSMVKHGYLNELNGEVLITVDSEDQEMIISLEEELKIAAEDTLKEQNIDPTVVAQKVSENKSTVKKLESKLDVSRGTANLLLNLVAKHDPSNLENISKMNKEGLREYFDELIDELEDMYEEDTEVGRQLDQLDDFEDENDNDREDDNDRDDDDRDDDDDNDINDDDDDNDINDKDDDADDDNDKDDDNDINDKENDNDRDDENDKDKDDDDVDDNDKDDDDDDDDDNDINDKDNDRDDEDDEDDEDDDNDEDDNEEGRIHSPRNWSNAIAQYRNILTRV